MRLVALGKMLQVVERLFLDLRGNNEHRGLEQRPILRGVRKPGSFPTPHSIPEKAKSEKAVAISLNNATHSLCYLPTLLLPRQLKLNRSFRFFLPWAFLIFFYRCSNTLG